MWEWIDIESVGIRTLWWFLSVILLLLSLSGASGQIIYLHCLLCCLYVSFFVFFLQIFESTMFLFLIFFRIEKKKYLINGRKVYNTKQFDYLRVLFNLKIHQASNSTIWLCEIILWPLDNNDLKRIEALKCMLKKNDKNHTEPDSF